MPRRKRQVVIVVWIVWIIFTIQSILQSLTLIQNRFDVRTDGSFSDIANDDNLYVYNEISVVEVEHADENHQRISTMRHHHRALAGSTIRPKTHRMDVISKSSTTKRPRESFEQISETFEEKGEDQKYKIKKSRYENRTLATEFNLDPNQLNFLRNSNVDSEAPCMLRAKQQTFAEWNSTKIEIPLWQRKLNTCGKLGHMSNSGQWGYFLAELLQVRIYKDDLAKWTVKELKQWIHFMFLAGVDHIFLCDHYKNESERLDKALEKYINLGLVSYFDWSHINEAIEAQVKCYEHIIDRNAYRTMWTIAVDMDEYPISPTDKGEDFLVRYLKNKMSEVGPRLSEISMPNFLMLGEGDNRKDLVSSRINRITREEYGHFVKPIFRPKRVLAGVHRNHILFGKHVKAESKEIKMLHYWGKRLQNWGPDTDKILSMTDKTNFMSENWEEKIRNSLLAFKEFDAFSAHDSP